MIERHVITHIIEYLAVFAIVFIGNLMFFVIKMAVSFGFFGAMFFLANLFAVLFVIIMLNFFNKFERIQVEKSDGKS